MILFNRNQCILFGLALLSIVFLFNNSFAQSGRGNYSIQGVVLSKEGKPIPGVKVIAVLRDNSGIKSLFYDLDGRPLVEMDVISHLNEKKVAARREVITDENGRWAVRLIQPGIWKLQAFAEDSMSVVSDIVVRMSKNDIELVLTRSDMDFLIKAKMVIYENRWDLAIEILKLFKICFPKSKQMDNAVYWLAFSRKKSGDSMEQSKEKNIIYGEAIQGLKQLIDLFSESEWIDDALILRIEIALKFVQMGQRQYERLIRESMELPDPEDINIRLAALDAYSHIDKKKAVNILMEMVRTHADPEVRKKSIFVIGSIGGAEFFLFLKKIAEEDPDESVRRAAVIWLKH